MMKRLLLFAVAMWFIAANAQVKDWNDPATWPNNQVPTSNNSVTILGGDTVQLTSDVTIRNITIQSLGVLDLNGYQLEFTKKLTNHGFVTSEVNGIIYANRADEIKGSSLIDVGALIWRDDLEVNVDILVKYTVYSVYGDLESNGYVIFAPGSFVWDVYTL